jgi:hypothetical protein
VRLRVPSQTLAEAVPRGKPFLHTGDAQVSCRERRLCSIFRRQMCPFQQTHCSTSHLFPTHSSLISVKPSPSFHAPASNSTIADFSGRQLSVYLLRRLAVLSLPTVTLAFSPMLLGCSRRLVPSLSLLHPRSLSSLHFLTDVLAVAFVIIGLPVIVKFEDRPRSNAPWTSRIPPPDHVCAILPCYMSAIRRLQSFDSARYHHRDRRIPLANKRATITIRCLRC